MKRAQLFVRASFLTALFSTTYVALSIVFSFEKGIYLMAYNIVGFLILPFLVKTRIPIAWLGNIYVFIGASAVITLTYFSGGVWSAIYPWIISIPVLALLVVNRTSGAFWGVVAFVCMLWFAYLALQGIDLPREYNNELHTEWYVTILPGLLLIILFISFVFEFNQSKALNDLKAKKDQLEVQKETIAEQSEKLSELIEEKDYIIRILAHDLRNPLKNINALIDFIKKEGNREKQNMLMEKISQSSINAIDLVNKVLEMDAIEQSEVNITMEKVNLKEVVVEKVEAIQKIALNKNITVKLGENHEDIFVNADKTYLILILDNLISNAIKFSPEKTTVNIELVPLNSHVELKIIDQGPGILPEERDKLFSKFSRLSSRPTGGESSTGLGLSLVKKYVSMIDGNVRYEANPKKGATFVVELPIVK